MVTETMTITITVTVTTTVTVMTAVMITMVETVVEMEITNHQIRNQKIQRSQISQVTKHVTGDVISDLTISPPFTDCD